MMKSNFWHLIRSPKTVAFLKLGVAIIGVIHALDELQNVSKKNTLVAND